MGATMTFAAHAWAHMLLCSRMHCWPLKSSVTVDGFVCLDMTVREAQSNGPTSAADEEGTEAGGANDGGAMVGDDDRAGGAENGGDEGGGEDEQLGVVRPEVMSVQPFTGPAMGGIVLTITGFSLWRR